MSLLSTLAAHDLGYLSTAALLDRLDRTLTTLEGLERHEGHFLNWYDTTTLAPLRPHYVSTVDSGNLAGALIALAQGLLQLAGTPQTETQRLEGVIDTAEVLATMAPGEARDAGGAPHPLAPDCGGGARGDPDRRARTIARARAAAGRHGGGRPDGRSTTRTAISPSGFARLATRLSACAGPRSRTSRTRRPCTRWRAAPRCWPTRCGSASSTIAAGASSRLATGSRTPTVQAAPTARSTICWRRKRDSPASSPSPRAMCRSTTGSISAAW